MNIMKVQIMSNQTDARIQKLEKIFPDKTSWDYITGFQEFNSLKKFDFDDPALFEKMVTESSDDVDYVIRVMGDTNEDKKAEADKPARRQSRSKKERQTLSNAA